MKNIICLLLAALTFGLFSACGTAPQPSKAFQDKMDELIKTFMLALCCFLMVSCMNRPFAILSDGTKVSLGQSIATKSTSEASKAVIRSPSGVTITLTDMRTGLDETSLPGAYFGYKTTVGVAGIAGHSKDVGEQQSTARAANARPNVTTTSTDPVTGVVNQTSTPPPAAIIPSINKGH